MGLVVSLSLGPAGSSTCPLATARRLRNTSCDLVRHAKLLRELYYAITHLQLLRKLGQVTPILVVMQRIAPDEADFILKSIPSLEIGYAAGWVPTMLTASTLLHLLQTYGVFDGLVVVFELARWQVDELVEYLNIAGDKLARSVLPLKGVVSTHSSW